MTKATVMTVIYDSQLQHLNTKRTTQEMERLKKRGEAEADKKGMVSSCAVVDAIWWRLPIACSPNELPSCFARHHWPAKFYSEVRVLNQIESEVK